LRGLGKHARLRYPLVSTAPARRAFRWLVSLGDEIALSVDHQHRIVTWPTGLLDGWRVAYQSPASGIQTPTLSWMGCPDCERLRLLIPDASAIALVWGARSGGRL
jgi:hypothetical protein